MSEEFDVFAGSMNQTPGQKPPAGNGAAPQKRKFHARRGKGFVRGNGGGPRQNLSPIRGANGEESVNPLLNAPLPTEPVV